MSMKIQPSTPHIQTQETGAKGKSKVEEKPIEAKTAQVGADKIGKGNTTEASKSIGKTTHQPKNSTINKMVNFGKKIIGISDEPKSTPNPPASRPQSRRMSQREESLNKALDSSNLASFTEESNRFNEAVDSSSKKNIFSSFKNMATKFSKLSSRDKEVYSSEMDSAKSQIRDVIKNNPTEALNHVTEKGSDHTKNIMNELKTTEQTFLKTIQSMKNNLKLLFDQNILSKEDFKELSEGWSELEKAVSQNVKEFEKLSDPNLSDADKLKIIQKQIDLKSGSPLRQGMEKLMKSYTKCLDILNKYEGKIPAAFAENFLQVKNGLITPIQRGPRYEMLTAELARKHPDPIFREVATLHREAIQANMQEINSGIN